MPSTDRKLELKAKTSVAQTGSQLYVYAKGLISLVSIVVNPLDLESFHTPVVCLVMYIYIQGTSNGSS
jgi:hypothetical protein